MQLLLHYHSMYSDVYVNVQYKDNRGWYARVSSLKEY